MKAALILGIIVFAVIVGDFVLGVIEKRQKSKWERNSPRRVLRNIRGNV